MPSLDRRCIRVLKALPAPPRADFVHQALRSREFTMEELVDLFGDEHLRVTLAVALEYVAAGSILVLGTRKRAYQGYLEQMAALRARRALKALKP
jgi:hypothetical protein